MVKGASRRVVVIKNPDRNFEQAIFIVKGELFRSSGMTEEEVMEQARAAAEIFVRNGSGKKRRCKVAE